MEKNPFNELISIIKETSKSNITENKLFNIGIIVSPLPNLVIKTSGIELDKDNLMIDKWLLDRHKESETYTEGEHSHKSKDYINKLNVGDKVIMLREGDMFYVISKVVSIDG